MGDLYLIVACHNPSLWLNKSFNTPLPPTNHVEVGRSENFENETEDSSPECGDPKINQLGHFISFITLCRIVEPVALHSDIAFQLNNLNKSVQTVILITINMFFKSLTSS